MELDIFRYIRELREKRRKLQIDKQQTLKFNEELAVFDKKQKENELIADVREAQVLLTSDSFPRFQKFLREYKSRLYRDLQVACLNVTEKNERLVLTSALAAKIDLLDTIINYPEKTIRELKRYED